MTASPSTAMRQVTSGSRPCHGTHAKTCMIKLSDCQQTSITDRIVENASIGAEQMLVLVRSCQAVHCLSGTSWLGPTLLWWMLRTFLTYISGHRLQEIRDKVVSAYLHLCCALCRWCVHNEHGWSRNSTQAVFLELTTQSTWQEGLISAFTLSARLRAGLWRKIKFVRVPGQPIADLLGRA